MRSVKTGLVVVVLSGFGVASAVTGCSADGGGGGVTEQPEAAPPATTNEHTTPPPDGGGAQDSKKDAPKDSPTDRTTTTDKSVPDVKPDVPKDTGSTNADATAGSACPAVNTIARRDCGLCGFQLALCEQTADGGLEWSTWGFCQNEVAGGCVP